MSAKKFIALIKRAQQTGPDNFDIWQEAFEVEPGETVEALAERIKKRIHFYPDTLTILPLDPGAKQCNS